MTSYPIIPVAKPRMTRRDVWKRRKCVMKYMSFKDSCREHNLEVKNGDTVTFMVPMPKSWSKKKKVMWAGSPHQSRPDLDNLLKGLLDIYEEDCDIWDIHVRKVWSWDGGISVRQQAREE